MNNMQDIMIDQPYLKWMAANTETDWCNDSAMMNEIDNALENGASGCTSNPPLSFQALTATPEVFSEELGRFPRNISGDEKVVELIGIVVRTIAKKLQPLFHESEETRGFIRAQVQPGLSADANAMLKSGKKFASWGPNIKVKIPGTAAGIWVLEELAALGIPTNPTVCVSIPQMVSAAEAYERGIKRAVKTGIKPAHSTSAFVMGRLQDYLTQLNEQRGTGLTTYELECAVLAAVKRCYALFNERGYSQMIMPAAFRCTRHVTELSGSATEMTIHPMIQELIRVADANGDIEYKVAIDNPVDPDAVDKVIRTLPEFAMAYEPEGIQEVDFDSFGATVMTLDNFNKNGWQLLKNMEIPQ
jgi:transaldolase